MVIMKYNNQHKDMTFWMIVIQTNNVRARKLTTWDDIPWDDLSQSWKSAKGELDTSKKASLLSWGPNLTSLWICEREGILSSEVDDLLRS